MRSPSLRSLEVVGSGVRAASLVLMLSSFLLPASLTGQAVDQADSLVGHWIESLGGMEMYEAFQSASFTVTTVLYDTISGREKRSRPRYVWIKKAPHGEQTRVERWETGGLIQQGFNGRDPAWAAIDGRMLPDTAKDAREALYVARDLFYWFGLPFKLRDPGVFLHYRGSIELPGAPWPPDPVHMASTGGRSHAVSVSFGEGVGEHQDVFGYYFTAGRATPIEVTYVEEGRENINRLVWGETRRAGNVQYPYVVRRDWITLSGKRTKSLVISDVVLNPDIPPHRFERP